MRLSRLNHGLPNSPLRCDMVSSTAALPVGIVPFLTPRALSLRRDGLLSVPYSFESEIVLMAVLRTIRDLDGEIVICTDALCI
jgi:hypothetical protein